MKRWLNQNQVRLSHILQVVVSLASVRCIIEIMRLQYSGVRISHEEVTLYLLGTLVAGIAVLAMTILSFYHKYKLNVAVSVVTIAALVIMKSAYLH